MDPIFVSASPIPYCNGKKLLAAIHKKVVLIHHGESVANAGFPTSDPASIPLTEDGRLQAEQIAEKMTIVPDLIIVSPYLRARQTAEPVIKRFPQAKVECWPEVREFTYLSPASCIVTLLMLRQLPMRR